MKFKLSQYNNVIELNDKNLLIYNSKKNSLVKLTNEEYYQISLKVKNNEIKNDFNSNKLINFGLIVERDCNEFLDYLSTFESSKYYFNSLNLTISISNDCNLKCKYCYINKKIIYKINSNFTYSLSKFINMFIRTYKTSNLNITWTGGEPLLYITEIEEMSAYFINFSKKNKLNYFANIITNGTLLNEITLKKLIKCNINSIQVSIEPTSNLDYENRIRRNNNISYNKIYDNIKKNKLIPSVIRVILKKSNKDYIENFIIKLYKDDILNGNVNFALGHLHLKLNLNDSLFYDLLDDREFSNLYFSIYEKLLNNNIIKSVPYPSLIKTCGAYKLNNFTIDSLGNIYKCFEDSFDFNQSVGNIGKNEIPSNNKNNLNWILKNYNFKNLDCHHCKILPICNGGCHMMRSYVKKSNIGNYSLYGCNEWKYGLKEGLVLFYNSKSNSSANKSLKKVI